MKLGISTVNMRRTAHIHIYNLDYITLETYLKKENRTIIIIQLGMFNKG